MRIRSTKPEFWRSRRIASVDWEARLVLKALESYVDDNGVGKDDLALIVSDTFPRDLALEPSRTLKRVEVAMQSLQEAGLLWRYEVDGNDLVYIAFWESIQYINRPSKGRLPRPDGTWDYDESKIGAPDLSPQEPSRALSAGTGEQGNRGTEEQTPPSAPATPARASAFDEFWKLYPKKVEKQDARRKFDKAVKQVGLDTVMEGVRRLANDPNLPEKQYIPNPAKWLGNGGWDNEPYPPRLDRPGGRPAQESLADRLPMIGGGL